MTKGEVQWTRDQRRYRATYRLEGELVAIEGRGAALSMVAGGLPAETAARLTLGRWVEEGCVQPEEDETEGTEAKNE